MHNRWKLDSVGCGGRRRRQDPDLVAGTRENGAAAIVFDERPQQERKATGHRPEPVAAGKGTAGDRQAGTIERGTIPGRVRRGFAGASGRESPERTYRIRTGRQPADHAVAAAAVGPVDDRRDEAARDGREIL